MAPPNIDDFLREVQEDELRDKIDLAKYASVSEYAKAIGEQPQLVHYYIRSGKIKKGPCECCGRSVINVEEANKIFAEARRRRER